MHQPGATAFSPDGGDTHNRAGNITLYHRSGRGARHNKSAGCIDIEYASPLGDLHIHH